MVEAESRRDLIEECADKVDWTIKIIVSFRQLLLKKG